jgi:hypothetical protein
MEEPRAEDLDEQANDTGSDIAVVPVVETPEEIIERLKQIKKELKKAKRKPKAPNSHDDLLPYRDPSVLSLLYHNANLQTPITPYVGQDLGDRAIGKGIAQYVRLYGMCIEGKSYEVVKEECSGHAYAWRCTSKHCKFRLGLKQKTKKGHKHW